MVREYELMYIVRPELDEEALQTAVDSVKTLVEAQGGEVLKTTMWGKRRLAYEVRHLRDGYYVILKLSLDGTKVGAIERALRIHDTVFRHMLVVDEVGADEEGDAEGDAEGAAQASTDSGDNAEAPAAAASATSAASEDDDVAPETESVAVGAGVDDEEEN